jgi:hypothetical protein
MKKVKSFQHFCITFLSFLLSNTLHAQVPVREEPRHHPVFQNKYIRLLDVWLPPGDTTMYHIHSTPSVFLVLSYAITGWQIKGKDWVKVQDSVGKTWYRSFSPDSLVHRVANFDTVPFHVNDIEMLAPYHPGDFQKKKALPFTVLFENERVITYQLMNSSNTKEIIQGRGPVVAELVKGDGIVYHDDLTKQMKEIKVGSFLYIEPGAAFYFTSAQNREMNLVLFEFK